MASKKIYVVTDGCYSDYGIKGIYSTKAKAEKAKELFCADNDIEEWEIDALPNVPKGMARYCVQMDELGNSLSVQRENAQYKWDEDWRPCGDDKTVAFDIWARNDVHAVKIANERRTQLLASGEWTTDWNAWRAKWLRDKANAKK